MQTEEKAATTRHRLRSLQWVAVLCVAGGLVACKPSSWPSLSGKPDASAAARALPLAEEARKRLMNGDTAGALVSLDAALKADRTVASIHHLLGQVRLAVGDVVAAEAAFTDALRLGAERHELVLPLAAALIGRGQPQALLDQTRLDDAGLPPHVRLPLLLLKAEAAASLDQTAAAQKYIDSARALNPAGPDSWLAEARIRLLAGQAEGAVAPAERGLTLALALAQAASPASAAATNTATLAQALTTRADVALALGDHTAAQSFYKRAIAADPESPAAHDARVASASLQLEILGDSPASAPLVADVEALAKAAPGDPRVSFLTALLADRQNRPDEARKALLDVAQTMQRVPAEALRYRPQLLLMGGLALLALGDTDKARGHLEIAQRDPASSGPATRLVARSYLADNNVERAITVLEAHLKQRPLDQQALLMLVGAHLSLGRHTRAINLLQDTLARKHSAAVRGMLAAGNASTGGLQAAQGELTSALKATPGHTGLQAALCTLQLHSGQPLKALQNAQALAQREPDKPGWQHLLGVAHLRLGQTAAARRAFEAAVRLDPGFAAPQVALARLEASQGDMGSAQKHLQSVLLRQPRHADALFEMGRIDLQRQQSAAAQGWFEKAQAAAAQGDNQAALALFDLHLGQNKLSSATAVLRPLALRQPDDLLVMLAQARLALANNEVSTAKTLLTRATVLAGYEAGALVQVALLHLQMHQQTPGEPTKDSGVPTPATAFNTAAGAQYALEKALADNPGLLAAQALMVDVELRQREYERAQTRVQQLLASHPRMALVQALQGDVALARGQTAVALAAYRRAHQMEPSSASQLRVLRTLSQTDAAAANTAASQWLEQRPNDHAVRRVLADSQARLGQYPDARANYELIVKATPGDAETLNNLAHVLLLLKDPGALAAAERALEAQPGAAHIMATAGWANIVAGKTERGMNWLRDARLREPNNADTRYFMAAALAQLGRKAEARTEATSAQALGRPFVHAKDTEALLESLR